MHAPNSISSSVQYSYSCHYFSPCCRRFFGTRFLSPSCLPFAFSYQHYLTIPLSLPLALELGRRLRCRGQTARFLRVSRSSFPNIRFVFYLYDFIPRSMLHPPSPTPNQRRHPSSCFVRVRSYILFLYDPLPVELICAFVLFGFPFLRFASVIPILNDHLALYIEHRSSSHRDPSCPSPASSPIILPVLYAVFPVFCFARDNWGSFWVFWVIHPSAWAAKTAQPVAPASRFRLGY